MQVYLINVRRNLCKFYDSTVEIEYLITDIINYFLSNLKIFYHTEDSTFHVDKFDYVAQLRVPFRGILYEL